MILLASIMLGLGAVVLYLAQSRPNTPPYNLSDEWWDNYHKSLKCDFDTEGQSRREIREMLKYETDNTRS